MIDKEKRLFEKKPLVDEMKKDGKRISEIMNTLNLTYAEYKKLADTMQES